VRDVSGRESEMSIVYLRKELHHASSSFALAKGKGNQTFVVSETGGMLREMRDEEEKRWHGWEIIVSLCVTTITSSCTD
jgi:hypothetical protein